MTCESNPSRPRRARWVSALPLALGLAACQVLPVGDPGFDVAVTESVVYTTPHAHNGAGPLWDFNASNIARIGDTVWVSGLNTVAGLPPLNNTECNLWKKVADAPWEKVLTLPGLTREPCPMGVLQGARLLVSTNATLNPPGKPGGGPAQPGLWEAMAADGLGAPTLTQPGWRAQAGPFSEHSYRSLAVDGPRGEVFVMQNVGYTHAEWAFRGGDGAWPAQGRLEWPSAVVNGKASPQRVAYVVAIMRDRAVHLLGVSDVAEPNPAWREFKRTLTGKPSDWVLRNLYYAWTPDIARERFRPWLQVASREATAGRIVPGDLWMDPGGAVHLIWEEAALDERLKNRFFADQAQRKELGYAVVRDGSITQRTSLMVAVGDQAGPVAHSPRLHVMPNGRLFAFFYVDGQGVAGKPLSENRLAEISGGEIRHMARVPMARPINQYVVASPRTGNAPPYVLDVLGSPVGDGTILKYVRVQVSAR